MANRMCAATERAMKRIAKGQTAYSAALKEGIALSTIYRALKREREKTQVAPETPSHDPGPAV